MRNKNLRYYLCSLILLALALAPMGEVSANYKSVSAGGGTGGLFTSLGITLAVNSGILDTTDVINAQGSATSYTFVASDMGKTITHNTGSSVADTLPQATTTGFGAGRAFSVINLGAGTVTITPTTSTINTTATLAIGQYQAAYIISDGANYVAFVTSIASGSGTVNNCATTGGAAYYSATGTTVSCNSIPLINTSLGYFDAEVGAGSLPAFYATASNSIGNVMLKFVSSAAGGRAWQFSLFANGSTVPGDYCLVDATGGNAVYCFSPTTLNLLSTAGIAWNSSTSNNTNTADVGITRVQAATLAINSIGTTDGKGKWRAAAYQVSGTKFTASGCSNGTTVGGATAGSYASGVTGACTVTLTMGDSATAANGWSCAASDQTTPANLISQTTGGSTTTAVITGTTVSGDVISFHCMSY